MNVVKRLSKERKLTQKKFKYSFLTYGFVGAKMNKVFSCNISASTNVSIFPVIRPGFFRFSNKFSPGKAVPPVEMEKNKNYVTAGSIIRSTII